MEVWDAIYWILIVFIVYKVWDFVIRIPKIAGIEEKYVLITGCDTGFGHEAAKQLDSIGLHVFSTCLTEQGEIELRKTCSKNLKTLRMDVTNDKSIKKAFDFVRSNIPTNKGLWGIVNNAGIPSKLCPMDWLQESDFRPVMDVNVFGLVNVTLTFLPLIKKSKGRIVNTASIGGRVSDPIWGPYCMTKYAVEGFSDSLRRNMQPFGVSVHIVEPGFATTHFTSTSFITSSLEKSWRECPKDVQEQYGEQYMQALKQARIKGMEGPINSSKLSLVVNAYQHALIGAYPRGRYVIGFFTKFLLYPITLMSERCGDWWMRKLGKNTPIPQCCQ